MENDRQPSNLGDHISVKSWCFLAKVLLKSPYFGPSPVDIDISSTQSSREKPDVYTQIPMFRGS